MAPRLPPIFEELAELMPEEVARALVEQLRSRPSGKGALWWDRQRGEWQDAWFDRGHIPLDRKARRSAT